MMGKKLPVLDTGFVRLVDWMGDDLSIVRAARVSYDAEWREHGDKNDGKLVQYLMKNHHTSPFEAVTMTFEVKAPIFVLRQWHRHRTWSYNEMSARYVELDEGHYTPDPATIGTQSKSSKQSRDVDGVEDQLSSNAIKSYCQEAFCHYHLLLDAGVPRELARSVLPLAAYSRMFATVDLHNFLGFCRLRLHPHAQWEIQQYAAAMLALAEEHIAPIACGAFRETLDHG